ncbi:transcription elongation factor GreA [Methylobacterium haplocladii]|uniref:Transcription elongation factor GreB n=1 Tax=Methylobacterium haplocladii TaxID=1176176 RepID=A0A512IP53_9HYPH|nr:transcription elongation factor GreA [Methylobacterium haplocladii]GEO99418.1 transcription elongation factor GreB [Methylobacterium haplocladii]GJD83246.1 Transcription elongation factor GreA [Methylobacterium haplocladii]GLS60674.1 transcription elongation factor GreB [Methylobacterium haplocladii]
MSIAFVREKEGGEAFEDLPDRPISPHTNFVTKEGLALIEAEVARLEAENASLDHNDKAETARVTRDLRYWSSRKNSAQVIERVEGDTVHFGSTVTVLRDDDEKQTFHIVGEDEADPAKGSISYVSPLAKAITGKNVGDTVEVNGQDVEITKVSA